MAHSSVKSVHVFYVSGAELEPWAWNTDTSLQELQFNNGAVTAAVC